MCSSTKKDSNEVFEIVIYSVSMPDGLAEGEDGVGGRGEAELGRGRHVALLSHQVQAEAPEK
jgi:hypothetical protein